MVERQLVEEVAQELQRMIREGSNTFGAPEERLDVAWLKCLACTTKGHCASVCESDVSRAISVGAERVGALPGIGPIPRNLAGYIDHTLLKPDATEEQVRYLCAEAAKYGFKSVCINPFWVRYCRDLLRGHTVLVCTVIGFPLGANAPETKAEEAARAVANGAQEVDMVINVGALKSGMDQHVQQDIAGVVRAAGSGVVTKVILETALLNDEQKIRGCRLAKAAGAHFVKTSTGFGPGGATAADIALMRRVVGPGMGVKASGGVRDAATAERMIMSGATRIGASASVRIVDPPLQAGHKAGGGGY